LLFLLFFFIEPQERFQVLLLHQLLGPINHWAPDWGCNKPYWQPKLGARGSANKWGLALAKNK
jgi:hypothetical protein